jgi:hypothetical protein
MPEHSLPQLVILVSTGAGLMLIGLVQAIGGRWSLLARCGATAGIAIGTSLLPLAIGELTLSAATAGLILIVTAALALVSSPCTAVALRGGLGVICRPTTRAALVATAGAVLAAGALVKFNHDDDAAVERDNVFLEGVLGQPQTRIADVSTTTDRGRRVALRELDEIRPVDFRAEVEHKSLSEMGFYGRVIRTSPVNDSCNCHGWVFTGGRYWLSQDDVEHILVDNDYVLVTDPRPGDLVIYRSAEFITHTAVVRAIVDGMPPLVEGKWGWMGVFLHGVGDSTYGTNYGYYRSERNGHLIAGLDALPGSKDGAEKLTGAQ